MAKTSLGIKILIGVLLVSLLGSIGYGFHLDSEKKEMRLKLEEEKQYLIEDLEDLNSSYNELKVENVMLNQELSDARSRVQRYIDTLRYANLDLVMLLQFKREIDSMRAQQIKLIRENDRLSFLNRQLVRQRDSSKLAAEEKQRYIDSLQQLNSELNQTIERASTLQTSSLNADGVKVRRSGRVVTTERGRRVEKVRVCFSLARNSLAKSGNRTFYITVLDPNNRILGDNKILSANGKTIKYSKQSVFYYEQDELDYCDYIDVAEGETLSKGRYVVNVFEDFRLVSQTDFTLR